MLRSTLLIEKNVVENRMELYSCKYWEYSVVSQSQGLKKFLQMQLAVKTILLQIYVIVSLPNES